MPVPAPRAGAWTGTNSNAGTTDRAMALAGRVIRRFDTSSSTDLEWDVRGKHPRAAWPTVARQRLLRKHAASADADHRRRPDDCLVAGGHVPSYTALPPTTVISTRASRISTGGMRVMSRSTNTKSASLPVSSEPVSRSWNEAYAAPVVYARSASSTLIFSAGTQPSGWAPSSVRRVTAA